MEITLFKRLSGKSFLSRQPGFFDQWGFHKNLSYEK
jgi:hypothetical protein